ncbi:DUF1376 domain-containing protein [Psychrobacter phage Psymv2]|uniref:DUF1376 domain-containing protein n=1 Tax=Psychrobacter phage Psymv2 TaxID=1071177 RepID=UPI00022A37A0|nr:DUF1376 domain-containing protein [Psychrobacter phage Psymv2]AEO00995.1 DUF1376 domain-containing protein [Psychrobacter phage Psymv2]
MHFYMFNPADFNNSARHLSLPERAIYRDLIDMYYHTEQAIDASDMDSLARRLLCTTDEYRASLDYILAEFFVKRGKRHHHHRIDKEIKNYKYKNGHTDVTQGVTRSNEHVTNDVTPCHNDVTQGNTYDDVTMTAAERQRKSRQDKRNMINGLIDAGVTVDKDIKAAELRELYAQHIDDVTSNVTDDVTQGVTRSNEQCHASHAKNTAITSNHELLTNNHKPVSERDAHTNAGEMIVDNFDGSVDNSFDDSQPSQAQPVPIELPQPTQPSANQPAAKADLIRDQRADDIENWEAPSFKDMQDLLLMAGKQMSFTGTQYTMHVEDFKAHYAEQALLGRALATESNRKAKLRKWLMGEIDKQAANQARQEKAKGTFNIDNEDWNGNSTNQQSRSNSDIPDVYHPSHITGKKDEQEPLFLNGLKRNPFPGMTKTDSMALVDRHVQSGEASVAAYDRLLADMKEAV